MTEQHSREKVCDTGVPSEPRCEAPSNQHPGIEREADRCARPEERGVSRRAAIVMGGAAAAGAVLPVEAMAGAVAAPRAAPLFLDRMRRAIEADRELRSIRAELARCNARFLRVHPDSDEARAERWRQTVLDFRQIEARRNAFVLSNGISCGAPVFLKEEVRRFEVILIRHILYAHVSLATPDWAYWYKIDDRRTELMRAGRIKWTTKT